MRLLPLSLATLLLAALNHVGAAPRTFTVNNQSTFEIDLPEGWTASVQTAEAEGGVAISVEPPSDTPLVLLITPFPTPEDIEDAKSHVRGVVEAAAENIQKVAVEQELILTQLDGSQCHGLYVSATDRTVDVPSRDDFKYIDQGAAVVGDLIMTFTILTNVSDAPERAQALDIVKSSRMIFQNDRIEQVQLDEAHLRDGCMFVDGEHYVSLQAATLYSMEWLQNISGAQVLARSFQSVRCEDATATIYYYQYGSHDEVQNVLPFVKGYLWGDGGPSRMHPERILTANDVLIVVSSKKPKPFVKMLEES